MSHIHQNLPIAEKLIANGLKLSEQLYRELQQEETILNQATQPELLDAVTGQKQPLIQELNLSSKQLGQILQTEQLPNDKEGMRAYFDLAEKIGLNAGKAAEDWQAMIEKTEQCRSLNEQNGAAIELLLRHTRQSLNILKGKPQTAATYGPDGNTRSDIFTGTSFSV